MDAPCPLFTLDDLRAMIQRHLEEINTALAAKIFTREG